MRSANLFAFAEAKLNLIACGSEHKLSFLLQIKRLESQSKYTSVYLYIMFKLLMQIPLRW